MNFNDYYSQQSIISDPGYYQDWFNVLPGDAASLCEISRGVMMHFLDIDPYHHAIPIRRLSELNLRYIDKMIEQVFKLNGGQLQQINTRLIGSCRDFSLLVCAMLRHKKIPARIRFGFSTFHIPGFHHDQVLLEYWDVFQNKWCLADPRVNQGFIHKYKLNQDTQSHDMPRDAFLTAGEAWKLCRYSKKSATQFGTGLKNRITGWAFIRNKLIQDLAALNKMELFSWDCWGMMLKDRTDDFMKHSKQVELLDYVAELTTSEIDIQKINTVYREDDLRVPSIIFSDSQIGGAKNVELRTLQAMQE